MDVTAVTASHARQQLFEGDIGVQDVVVNQRLDIGKSRLAMTVEGTPESVRLLRSEESHVKNAVPVAVLESADRPAAGRHFEVKNRIAPRRNPHLLSRLFEEAIGPPKRNIEDVCS